MIQLQRVLWPTDFSELSLHGGRYARELARQFNAELHVVHVAAPPMAPDVSVTMPVDLPSTYGEEELLDAARAELSHILEDELSDVDRVVADVFFGEPARGICRYADEHEIELVVVCTHGRTGLRHVLIGSTTERVVQHAPCPVLVIKNPERDFVLP